MMILELPRFAVFYDNKAKLYKIATTGRHKVTKRGKKIFLEGTNFFRSEKTLPTGTVIR